MFEHKHTAKLTFDICTSNNRSASDCVAPCGRIIGEWWVVSGKECAAGWWSRWATWRTAQNYDSHCNSRCFGPDSNRVPSIIGPLGVMNTERTGCVTPVVSNPVVAPHPSPHSPHSPLHTVTSSQFYQTATKGEGSLILALHVIHTATLIFLPQLRIYFSLLLI